MRWSESLFLRTFIALLCALSCDSALAQPTLIAVSAESGNARVHTLRMKGRDLLTEDLGLLSPYRFVGHITGRFLASDRNSLLKVRRLSRRILRLSAVDRSGERIVRDLLLPRGIGETFLVMGGFDLSRDGIHDMAIIDASHYRLRWSIIENPLSNMMRYSEEFALGKSGDRVDWCHSKTGAVHFVAVAHRRNSRAVRLNIHATGRQEPESFLAAVPDRTNTLVPIRLRRDSSRTYCFSLYDPDRLELFVVENDRALLPHALPEKRCNGEQRVMQAQENGDLFALELCKDNRYILAERKNSASAPVDLPASEGALPEGTREIRRSDVTTVSAAGETQPGVTPTPSRPDGGGDPAGDPTPTPLPSRTPTATLTATVTPTYTASATATPTATATPNINFVVYVGVWQSSGDPRIARINFNSQTNAVSFGSPISLASVMGANSIRAFADTPNGNFITNNITGRVVVSVNTSGAVSNGPTLTTGGTPAEINGIHGMCMLPDGSIIAGGYTGTSGNSIHQFSSNGVRIRTVYTTTINAITDCAAVSNTELFLIDYDANGDSDGDIIKLTLSGGVWSQAARWDQSTSGVPAGSSIFSLVLATDGHLYAPAQNAAGSRNRKMIRCLNTDLTQCAPYGSDIYTTGALLQGAVQIPGTTSLLLAHETQLYRYELTTGTVQAITSLAGQGISQVRHLRIR